MTIILSATGTQDYKPTHYQFEDGAVVESEAGYFVFALTKYLRPTEVIVLLTEDARILQWEAKCLQQSLESINDVIVRDVTIPNGINEDDLWVIFDKIAASIPPKTELILDITHGFRSLPMVMLTAASYLQQSRDIRIVGVYYGAFEAVERDVQPKPVFNIGPFMTLLDWNNAVDAFKRTGECIPLARLLSQTQTNLYKNRSLSRTGLPKQLKSVATQLENLSLALDLVRPDDVIQTAFFLSRELKDAESEFPIWAKPFNLLLEIIREQFANLAMDKPREGDLDTYLDRQWRLIEWYVKFNRFSAAVLLAREWVISWFMCREGHAIDKLFLHKEREEAEQRLKKMWDAKSWESPVLEQLVKIQRNLSDIRNDLAHASMRERPQSAQTLSKLIQREIDHLRKVTQKQL